MRSSCFLRGAVFLASLFFIFQIRSLVNLQPGQSHWTVASNLARVADMVMSAAPTLLFQSDADASIGVITIDKSGNYKLAESVHGQMVVTATTVGIDLNGYEFCHDIGDEDIITIHGKNVTIFNGVVRNSDVSSGTASGILVRGSASSVKLKNLVVVSCANGLKLNGSIDGKLEDCFVVDCDAGIVLSTANFNFVRRCRAVDCRLMGYGFFSSQYNVVLDCHAMGTQNHFSQTMDNTSDGRPPIEKRVFSERGFFDAYGFYLKDGRGNLLMNCVAEQIIATDASGRAAGFMLTGDEVNTNLTCCLVNTVIAPDNSNSVGIQLDGTVSDCLIKKNKLYNCGVGLIGSSGNVAVENVACNNRSRNYLNVSNLQAYNPLLTDNSTTLHNVAIPSLF